MSVRIADFDINPRIVAAAVRGLNSPASVLNLSGAEAERLTGLNSNDVTQLKDAVSEAVLIKAGHVTALELWNRELGGQPSVRRLSTGCPVLNKYLRGGILASGITEIVGESAAGAVYICTEDVFPSKRLQQMAQHFALKWNSTHQKKKTAQQFSDHIFVEHVADFDGLDVCLKKKLPVLLTRGLVKLVVVDSVAALYRCHYENHSLVARAKHLAALATHLRRLSDQYSVPVVCVNQVTANMSDALSSSSPSRQSTPALGLVWADYVTCRFLLSRQTRFSALDFKDADATQDLQAQLESGSVSLRQLEVMFAPHLPPVALPLLITSSGVICPA